MRIRALLALAFLSAATTGQANAVTVLHQPVSITRSSAVIDVLIVPPAFGQIVNGNGVLNGLDPNEVTPFANSYLRAVENSVKDFDRAIAQYGSSRLKAGLKINRYVVGRDTIPQAALTDPEIVIAEDINKTLILGIAIYAPRVCVVLNSSFLIESMSYEDMFNINGQEYGHCLGLGHVNEAPAPEAQWNLDTLRHDVLNGSYPDTVSAAGTHLHCVSNLNIAGLEQVYRSALTGQEENGDATGVISSSSYTRPASVPGSCVH